MYKKTKQTFMLDEKDKLVMTFENGELMLLINNSIKVHPVDIEIKSTYHDFVSIKDGTRKLLITSLKIICEDEN